MVAANSPYKSIHDIIAAAKKNPKKLTMGGGSATGNEIMMGRSIINTTGAEFNLLAMANPPEMVINVINGNLAFGMQNPPHVLEQIRAGNLRPILAMAPKRYDEKLYPEFKGVPTVRRRRSESASLPTAGSSVLRIFLSMRSKNSKRLSRRSCRPKPGRLSRQRWPILMILWAPKSSANSWPKKAPDGKNEWSNTGWTRRRNRGNRRVLAPQNVCLFRGAAGGLGRGGAVLRSFPALDSQFAIFHQNLPVVQHDGGF